jgi:hypothetical protein
MAIACGNGCRKIVPLMLRLWSSVHPEYVGENDEVEQVIGQIASTTNGREFFYYFQRWGYSRKILDSGGERKNLV